MEIAPKVIGVDGRFFGEAGPGRYAKAVVEHLEELDKVNTYKIFLRDKGFSQYNPHNPNFIKVRAHYKWYSWEEQLGFLATIFKEKVDLLYVPHFNIPVLYPGKLVTAIPDIIMHSFSTERGTTLPKPYFKFKKMMYKLVIWLAVARSKRVIVPSKAVIEDFRKVYPAIPADKYVLAYEGVDPVFLDSGLDSRQILASYGITKPFLLYISSMYEHKNVPFLVQAFKRLVDEGKFDGQLVLVGKKDKFSESVQFLVAGMGLEDKVLLPGLHKYIPDKELVAIRKEALLYVFPSLKEGFSLTPLEAQAVGLPCLISAIDVHREIYGDSVAYFDPTSMDDLVTKMDHLIHDASARADLVAKGRETVGKYDWAKTAQITLDTFSQFLSER